MKRFAGLASVGLVLLASLFGDCGKRAVAAEADGNAELYKALGRDDYTVVPLWPERDGPGETRPDFADGFQTNADGVMMFRPVVRAEMIVIPPRPSVRSIGVAVLVCPGGGYGALENMSIGQMAEWLNEMGATAVLLKYRVPRRSAELPAHHLPLMDAQRSLGLLRSRAAEWQLAPDKIGIVGFSAGGHLAAMASNHHERRNYEAVDDHDRVACRPDFCLLMYPAYLTKPILEFRPDPALEQERMSPERTPPTLIAVVRPDKFTVGCISYLDALRRAQVPAELHIFSSGGHGGCFDRYPLLGWGYEATRFLKDHHILDAAAAAAGEKWLREREARVMANLPAPPDNAGAARTPPLTAPRVEGEAPKQLPADALADVDLTAGDAELRKLLGPAAPIIPLWPAGSPADEASRAAGVAPETNTSLPGPKEILRIGNVSRPTLAIMRPAQPDGRAVIVCPGGGYHILASEHEGVEAGRWLNEQGITAFILKYRVPERTGAKEALEDGQRAVSLVRSRAAEFGIDPDWIGMLGFSAGGHLAAECCHYQEQHGHEQRSYEPFDAHDKASCRPSFALLIYPGRLSDAEGRLHAAFTNARRNQTPPMFLAFAANDRLVPGALPYVAALRAARVPTALHIYESGGHGQGLRPQGYPFSRWTFAAERWLADLTLATTSTQ